MRLYLIRHAQADERGPKYPNDSTRPLIGKGHKQAEALTKALKRLEIRFDRLFSSPYTRALETAEPLLGRTEGELETLVELTAPDYSGLLERLVDILGMEGNALHVALVGHEPYLSELTSHLLTGDPDYVRVKFKKAMLVQLSGPLRAGAMTLELTLPARVYKKL